ncbi:MAG: pilus assembly protein TadG-related protein [Acidimicrobiia bacterium]
MSSLYSRLASIHRSEEGGILTLTAVAMVLLLGLSAFATDLGWFYVNANRIQRAADAAALGGVIHMPQNFPQASTDAHSIASANGYVTGVDSAIVSPAMVPDEPHQLRVTVSDVVPTFFLRVFGQDFQSITRTATAEYIPPLPMGSPDNLFGNPPGCAGGGPGCPEFWANIHGRFTTTRMGDGHSSYCNDGSSSGAGCPGPQDGWRANGYTYGIEVDDPGTSSFTLQLLDMNLHVPGGDHKRTGDHNVCGGCGGAGHTVQVTVFNPDPTPLDLSDNVPVAGCTSSYGPLPEVPDTDPYVWVTHCSVNNPVQAIYPVRIRVLTSNPADDTGLNRYSIRVLGSGGSPRLYALGDMSLFNNITAGAPNFYLAEVADFYRGKTFVVELYDPGDAQHNVPNIINIVAPTGGTWPSCRFFEKPDFTSSWTPRGTLTPCSINATRPANDYNGDWLKVEMDLPDTYACGATCWWQVDYDYSGTAQDTTTWRAYVVGNPVHLIPNG